MRKHPTNPVVTCECERPAWLLVEYDGPGDTTGDIIGLWLEEDGGEAAAVDYMRCDLVPAEGAWYAVEPEAYADPQCLRSGAHDA